MLPQSIANIAEICAKKGVDHIVLSPGSRCAPLTIAFVRHPEIHIKTISDERSAAFIALGMSQQLNKPVGLVCTSGSAAYNYAPAVAEAFFQHIPLIVFTADRPPEWIDQLDGQTIRQFGIYGNHVKKSYQLPVSYEHADAKWHVERTISEAINLSNSFPQGPVHINVPLREPFYPASDEKVIFDKSIKIIDQVSPESTLNELQKEKLVGSLKSFHRVLIVAGQACYDASNLQALSEILSKCNIPVLAEPISNLHALRSTIKHHDTFLLDDESLIEDLKPDLLITFGKSVLSKNLKSFLRKNKPCEHWHIQKSGEVADTFQCLTKIIPVEPAYFFKEVFAHVPADTFKTNYGSKWLQKETRAQEFVSGYFKNLHEFGEFSALYTILDSLPDCDLHIANSMSIRYVSLLSINVDRKETEIFANRGTSGIDGSNSTAVGAALVSKKLTVLITGDMAFFYDRNAFWHNYKVPNLKIIVLNNHAGGIFRLIEGPSSLPELEEFFETRQKLEAQSLAKEFNFAYYKCDSMVDLQGQLISFFKEEKTSILEIITESELNHNIFKNFKLKYRSNEC